MEAVANQINCGRSFIKITTNRSPISYITRENITKISIDNELPILSNFCCEYSWNYFHAQFSCYFSGIELIKQATVQWESDLNAFSKLHVNYIFRLTGSILKVFLRRL